MVPTSYSQAKLFDKKFVALTLKDARRCDKCKCEYDVKYKYTLPDNKPHSNRPVLLNCGHNICENCIYQNRHKLCCTVCLVPIEFEHMRYLRRSYDLNFTLLGQLINSKSFLSSESCANTNLLAIGMPAKDFAQKCSECEQAVAVGICMHCRVDFCKRCFVSVHQNSKVLKKHKLSEFKMQSLQLQLPKPQICLKHKRLQDRYCVECQGIYCLQCLKTAHKTHRYGLLTNENANHKDKILNFMETMKQTRENIRKSQKEVRASESRLEEFAAAVVLDLNDFFLELHNHLQLEELRILDEFRKSAQAAQKAIHETMSKLYDGQTILNNMRTTLEGYIFKPPHEFHINEVLEQAALQLEQVPCQIDITEIEKSPFTFKKLKDLREEISKSYEIEMVDPKITIRLTPIFNAAELSFEISSTDLAVSPEPMSPTRTAAVSNCRPSSMSLSSSSIIAVGRSKRTGRVTKITNPGQFFVQDEQAINIIRSGLVDISANNGFVESITIGEMYIVYHSVDEAWFRAVVNREAKQSDESEESKYKVFFLDYGIYHEIPRKWFRVVPDKIKSIPAAAVACKLVDIAPVEKKWPLTARELMMEIIQNNPVQVLIHDTTKSPWSVELFTTHTTEPISIREALLYTGLAIDASATVSPRDLKFLGTKASRMKQRISRPLLNSGDFFRIQVIHIENPQQFFVIKFSQLEDLSQMENEMETEYRDKQNDHIYLAQLHMGCALHVDDKWYRGCVEEINGPDSIHVRLVDYGRSVIVNWRQLYILRDRFINPSEFAIECSVADIEPRQENDYEWTDIAVAEFTRMTSNPNMQITVLSKHQFRYQVVLNIIKKHIDISIGGMLVKFEHAVSTGESSAVTDNIHEKKSPVDHLIFNPTSLKPKTPSSAIRTLERTPVQVIHIKNPGEFYIQLVAHTPGIQKFLEELQIAQEQRLKEEENNETIDWEVNDHCMILTVANTGASEQWFRGIITNIDNDESERPYTVFLRDKGITINEVDKRQLTPIDNLFDRVCNAATLCHLACVQPTGGIETWSNSATDEFTHNIKLYESLGATIQGSVANSSIPIVLWGITTETNDPLAPSTTKYTNINKVLVSAGLAHLIEKIDVTRQMDMLTQMDVEDGHQTLVDWYEKFKSTLNNIQHNLKDNSSNEFNMEDVDSEKVDNDLVDTMDDEGIATEWLPPKPIVKTVFTAYPTYVDDEGIVYLHDAKDHSLLSKMRSRINQIVKQNQSSPKKLNETWAIGTPCLARYHLDNSLYRANVHRHMSDKTYEVRFVDYGNIETCESSDLYRITAFPNIPIQAVRFRIHGIRPRGGQASFPTPVLDLIHGVIVDKLCAVRVAPGQEKMEIKKCSIRFDQNDLATYLIKNGFVAQDYDNMKLNPLKRLTAPLPSWRPTITAQFLVEIGKNSDDDFENAVQQSESEAVKNKNSNQNPKTNSAAALFNPDEYKQMFEKMKNAKLCRSVPDVDAESNASTTINDVANFDEEDDLIELEFSFRSNYWQTTEEAEHIPQSTRQYELDFNYDRHFDPLESSSLLSNFSGIDAFKTPKLPTSVKSFFCEMTYARSPTIIHIFPHLSELEYRQIELARRIQVIVRKLRPATTFEVKMPCLARYSKDRLWYRAIVRSYNASSHHVKVFYVDFLNSEVLPEQDVRQCPKDLLSWPLRTFEMKLYGVKPNPNVREKDVKRALKKCLTDRTMYAKIIRERGNVPEITLYKSQSEQEAPVYEDLIAQNLFCRE